MVILFDDEALITMWFKLSHWPKTIPLQPVDLLSVVAIRLFRVDIQHENGIPASASVNHQNNKYCHGKNQHFDLDLQASNPHLPT